jgi:hypothetical protein
MKAVSLGLGVLILHKKHRIMFDPCGWRVFFIFSADDSVFSR